jgi:hypothetical protein
MSEADMLFKKQRKLISYRDPKKYINSVVDLLIDPVPLVIIRGNCADHKTTESLEVRIAAAQIEAASIRERQEREEQIRAIKQRHKYMQIEQAMDDMMLRGSPETH